MSRPATISGVPVHGGRITLLNSATRTVDVYSEIITPPEGCYRALLYVRLEEAPVPGNELKVLLLGCNEPQAGESFNPALAVSLIEPVQLVQFGNQILIAPEVPDGGPGMVKYWTRRGVVDRRIRVWFYGANGQSYTYSAAIHFIP